MTWTYIPTHSIFQGTSSILIWEVQQYHVFDFFEYLSHQTTLRRVQETKSSKTLVETDTGVTWKVYHICSLQIWNNKRHLKSSREKKVNVNVRFKFIGTLGQCFEAIIGKNPIPKKKQVAICLDKYHFNHPTWYNSLWTYFDLGQGAHNVYSSVMKKVQLWRSYCFSSTRVQAYIREPMSCDCKSHLKGYCSQFNQSKIANASGNDEVLWIEIYLMCQELSGIFLIMFLHKMRILF